MSTAFSGFDGHVVVISGMTTTDFAVTGFSCDVETSEVDVTTTSDGGWEDAIGAAKKVSGTFDFFFNPAISPFGVSGLTPGAFAAMELTCSGPTTRATATAAVSGGTVTALSIVSAGSGYVSVPFVSIEGIGTGATATATLSGSTVASLAIGSGGTGFTLPPSVSITGGGDQLVGNALITKVTIKSAVKEAISGTCAFRNKGGWTLPS